MTKHLAPCHHVGDLEGIPDSSFGTWPGPVVVTIWLISQWVEDLSLCLSHFAFQINIWIFKNCFVKLIAQISVALLSLPCLVAFSIIEWSRIEQFLYFFLLLQQNFTLNILRLCWYAKCIITWYLPGILKMYHYRVILFISDNVL